MQAEAENGTRQPDSVLIPDLAVPPVSGNSGSSSQASVNNLLLLPPPVPILDPAPSCRFPDPF